MFALELGLSLGIDAVVPGFGVWVSNFDVGGGTGLQPSSWAEKKALINIGLITDLTMVQSLHV